MPDKMRFTLLDRLVLAIIRWSDKRIRRVYCLKSEIAKSKMKRCGKGVRIHGPNKISGLSNMELGDNVHIGQNCFIQAKGGLIIGDNTHISRNLLLYTTNHHFEG